MEMMRHKGGRLRNEAETRLCGVMKEMVFDNQLPYKLFSGNVYECNSMQHSPFRLPLFIANLHISTSNQDE